MRLLRVTDFVEDAGYCWIADLPQRLAVGDTLT